MHMPMELPRISGLLFNCSLNCALPTLLENLEMIAFESDASSYPNIDAYRELKTCFENWYLFQEPLTFANFYTLLSSWTHSEQELILAPIFRRFMVSKCNTQEQKMRVGNLIRFNNEFIDSSILEALRDERLDIALSSEGRYMPLDASEANELFYQHFGLYFQVTENSQIKNLKPENLDLKVVDAHLRAGHYELSETPPTQQLGNLFKDSLLLSAYEQMTCDDSFVNTNTTLSRLIPYVSQQFSNILREKKSEVHAQDYLLKARELKLHDDSIEGKMTFTIILLTLMQNDTTTQEYANQQLAQLQKPVQERLCKVNILINEIIKNIMPSDTPISRGSEDFSDLAQYFNISKINRISIKNQISAQEYYNKAIDENHHGQNFTDRMTFALILLNLMANEENEFAKSILSSLTDSQGSNHDEQAKVDDLFSAIAEELKVPNAHIKKQFISKSEYQRILQTYQTSLSSWDSFLQLFGCKHASGTYWALKSLENQEQISEHDIKSVLEKKPAFRDSAHNRRFLFWTDAQSQSFYKEESGTDRLLKTLKSTFQS